MATFKITTTDDVLDADDGFLSLREAVDQANATAAADRIVFAGAIEGQTLVLTGGELTLSQDVTIDGDANDDGVKVTLDGNSVSTRTGSRHLSAVGAGTDISLLDLNFVNGNAYYSSGGGSISSRDANIVIDNSTFTHNEEGYSSGGAINMSGGSLAVKASTFSNNFCAYGLGAAIYMREASLTVTATIFANNRAQSDGGYGGAIAIFDGEATIADSSLTGNSSFALGGAIFSVRSLITIEGSSIVSNTTGGSYEGDGGGIWVRDGSLALRNSTITGNEGRYNGETPDYTSRAGGIALSGSAILEIANSIVAGNSITGAAPASSDIIGTIGISNGHNIFGTDVVGNVAGDVENAAAAAIFAAIDPATGGGAINADGVALLRADVTNPALGGADRFEIGATDQMGHARPSPAGTNGDIGAVESSFAHSTRPSGNNDTLTGTGGVDGLSGLAGNDLILGLGGKDTLDGGRGSDFLEGGAGNDRLKGATGIDIAGYRDGDLDLTVDLRGDASGDTDTARRGGETDTLTGIEGAIGSGGDDRFFGDGAGNWFQGGGGSDIFTGRAGRDLYDLNRTQASPAGAGRDVITDFRPGTDDIDLTGIDADTTVAGNQAFRWVGTAALTGPGEAGYSTAGGNTIIRMSTDGDAASEGEIQLTGIKTPTELDFYL